MQHTNIYLEEDQLRALQHLAVEERQSVADLVSEAVNDYLARSLADETLWRERLEMLRERVGSRVPGDMSSQELEADISVARDEVRQLHRAARIPS